MTARGRAGIEEVPCTHKLVQFDSGKEMLHADVPHRTHHRKGVRDEKGVPTHILSPVFPSRVSLGALPHVLTHNAG